MKVCTKCGTQKPLDEFYSTYNSKYPNAKKSYCICCHNEKRQYRVLENMVSRAKLRARKKNWAFDLDVEFVASLRDKQDNKCALSGRELDWEPTYEGKRLCPPYRASLDRIDSSKGYTKDNVQLVTDIVNRLKSAYPQDVFVQMCTDVSNHYCN